MHSKDSCEILSVAWNDSIISTINEEVPQPTAIEFLPRLFVPHSITSYHFLDPPITHFVYPNHKITHLSSGQKVHRKDNQLDTFILLHL